MQTCRLSTSHVRIGMPLPGNVYDGEGKLLLSKGYLPESQSQIDLLLARGMYVEISVFEALFKPIGAASAAPAMQKKFDPFLVRNALKISLNRVLRGVLDATAMPAQVLEFAEHLLAFADTDAEAATVGPDRHFTGPAGSCFLENTFGMHRGLPPQGRPRLIFQVTYCLMGLPYAPAKPVAPLPPGFDPFINRFYFKESS